MELFTTEVPKKPGEQKARKVQANSRGNTHKFPQQQKSNKKVKLEIPPALTDANAMNLLNELRGSCEKMKGFVWVHFGSFFKSRSLHHRL